jgi:hypothetical protein
MPTQSLFENASGMRGHRVVGLEAWGGVNPPGTRHGMGVRCPGALCTRASNAIP